MHGCAQNARVVIDKNLVFDGNIFVFVRDADGKVSKVLSQYHDGKMASSEGLVKYDKRGDTTFVTFLDSARKHPDIYRDAQDFYQAGIVNDKVVYYKDYGWAPGYLDSTQTKYEYDAAGNLTTETYQYNNNTPVLYTYQRTSEHLRSCKNSCRNGLATCSGSAGISCLIFGIILKQ